MKKLNKFRSDKFNKLIIHKRGKSPNWYGWTKMEGEELQISSGTDNKQNAIEILEQWYMENLFKIKNNIPLNKITFESVADEWIESVKQDDGITDKTKGTKIARLRVISKCKDFMRLDVATCTVPHIKNTFYKWISNQRTQHKHGNKKYRGKTIQGYMVTISDILRWCAEQNYRQHKLEGLTKIISKEESNQKTQTDTFTNEDYKILKKVSKERIASGHSKSIRLQREKLHHWIIFMVNTGLRTESECMTLHFEDIEMINKDGQCYTKINIRDSKVKEERTVIGLQGSYYAIKNLKELYERNGIPTEGSVWKQKSLRNCFNQLLEFTGLKHQVVGGKELVRHSISLRKFYINSRIDQDIHPTKIGQQVGNSSSTIDKYYAVHKRLDEDNIIELLKLNKTKQS